MVKLIKEHVPWWFKIGIKMMLARLPLPYTRWRSIGIFQHGFMLDPEYALHVFMRHYAQVQAYLPQRYSVLELGPGDSLATAAIAAAHGADKVWLVDVGPYASLDIAPYRPLLRRLECCTHLADCRTMAELLAVTNTMYLTEGLKSLKAIPDDSVDFVFSQAVLEHVALDEFAETIHELARVQSSGGVSSHRIDLQDHLAHGLHSLRFSRSLWESDLFARSGFYTNRLRASQIVETFERAGFEVMARQDDCWPALPLRRDQLHADFRALSEADLRVRGSDLVLRKRR